MGWIGAGCAAAFVLAASLSRAQQPEGCASPESLVAQMLTPITAVIPRDGGAIVVGLRSRSEAARPMPPIIGMSRGRRNQELTPQPIAPGLVRFVAPSQLQTGSFSSGAFGTEITFTVGRSPMPGVPTRPALQEARRVAATGLSATRVPRVEIRARLEFPVPEGIVAILTYWGESSTPASWQPAVQGQVEILAWRDPGSCEARPPGEVAPPAEGGTLRIAYVDAFGQTSLVSGAVPVQ